MPHSTSLRTRINLIIGALMGLFLVAFIYVEIDAVRRSVAEENEAQHRVARHLLDALAGRQPEGAPAEFAAFLRRLGRVRGNEVTLYDSAGGTLYASPPSTYKAGRDAPAWFATLVAPAAAATELPLAGGRLVISANPSRAILYGWDTLVVLLGLGVALFVIANALVFWLVGRTLRPLAQLADALGRIEGGALATRLPELPGREARLMGHAFNRMAEAMDDRMAARVAAAQAAERLAENREISRLVQAHVEDERRAIARELHDEMAQAVTAIRSLAVTIAQRAGGGDETIVRAAGMVAETAGHIQESVSGLIHRLRPPALDSLGIGDALEDLLDDWRLQQPDIAFALHAEALPERLAEETAITAYRAAQEALTNAVRHAGARQVTVHACVQEGMLVISVEDDGRGLPAGTEKPGHYGLRSMRERVEAGGGSLLLGERAGGGARIEARLPMELSR